MFVNFADFYKISNCAKEKIAKNMKWLGIYIARFKFPITLKYLVEWYFLSVCFFQLICGSFFYSFCKVIPAFTKTNDCILWSIRESINWRKPTSFSQKLAAICINQSFASTDLNCAWLLLKRFHFQMCERSRWSNPRLGLLIVTLHDYTTPSLQQGR